MNGRTFAAVLLVIVLGVGAVFLGVTAYNAGVSAGLAQNIAQSGGDVVVAPGYPGGPYAGWGYGWGGGFSFFAFFGTLLFIFLIFGLIRAAFGWGRGWGRGGWGPGGPGHRNGYGAWDERVREVHDELHRGGGQPPSGDASQSRT